MDDKKSSKLGKTALLAALAVLTLTPYKRLPKILQNLKNVLENFNPVKLLYDWMTSMSAAEARVMLKPGDHIYCHRKGFYSHHGIYAGYGKVWEYDGKTLVDAHVQLSDLDDFTEGERLNRLNYDADFPPEEILRRAASKNEAGDYDLLRNNCMHYAFWCRLASEDDIKASEQVYTLLLQEGQETPPLAAGVSCQG